MGKASSADISLVREIKVQWRTDGGYSDSVASDISVTGAFINTPNPLPEGTSLGLRLALPGRDLSTPAIVRRAIPGDGMAVEFQSMSPDDRARLAVMVRQAQKQTAEQAAEAAKAPQTPAHRQRSRIQKSPERRSRTRYRFSAPVEVTESETGRSLSGHLSDLGHSGCYVKIEEPCASGATVEIQILSNEQSFRCRATVKSSHAGKGMGLIFEEIGAEDRRVLDEWMAASTERAWLATNRRSSQRVMMSIRVQVEAKDRFGADVHEDTKTISVTATGALLALEMELIKGQTVTLRDPVSQDALECSVDYVGSTQRGRREVGVSFLQPNRNLWRIAFPPSNWSTQDPYAKGS